MLRVAGVEKRRHPWQLPLLFFASQHAKRILREPRITERFRNIRISGDQPGRPLVTSGDLRHRRFFSKPRIQRERIRFVVRARHIGDVQHSFALEVSDVRDVEKLKSHTISGNEYVTGYSCFDESPDRCSVFLREPDPLVVGKTPH